MPILASTLLADEGRVKLKEKLDEMLKFIYLNPTQAMEIVADHGVSNFNNKSELMEDEQLMSRVLNSKKLHKKAKIVIYAHLDKMDHDRQKSGIQRDTARSFDEVEMDYVEIREKIYTLIRDEDPVEAKKLGILPGQLKLEAEAGVGIIKQDEESGLEAQVHVLVDQYWKAYESQFSTRINEVEVVMTTRIKMESEKLHEYLKGSCSAIEKELNMVALTHIQDFQQVKNATQEFVLAKDRLGRQVQIVVNIERQLH